MALRLDRLPVELLSSILDHLSYRDVLRCRQVCAVLKDVVDGDVRIQYKVELAIAGMEDGLHSTLTAAERLEVLRERQSAWRRLSRRFEERVPFPRENALWEFSGGVLAHSDRGRKLHFWQLPSDIRRIERREWVLEDVGVRVAYFRVDPAQDLLVLVEETQPDAWCSVHLRSMATGEAHPMAALAVLAFDSERPLYDDCSIQTWNDHLALLFTTTVHGEDRQLAEFILWNWKTGAVLMHMLGDDVYSFTFLPPGYILLLTYRCSGLIDAYIHWDTTDPCIVVLDLGAISHSSEPVLMVELEYLCAFTYPLLQRGVSIYNMELRTDPGPDWIPSPSLAVPFSVSRENRVFVVTMGATHDLPIGSTLLSFIPSSTLLSAIKSVPPAQVRRIFAWREWGPDGSHLEVAPPRFARNMPRYGCGSFFAMHVQPQSLSCPSSLTVELYDFNRLACRRALSSGVDADALVTTPTKLTGRASGIFQWEVTTHCPYLRRVVQIDVMHDEVGALLLGEDSLIIVSIGPADPEPYYRILSF